MNSVASRLPAVVVLLLGLLAAAPAATNVIGLARDRLHYMCAYSTMGGTTGDFGCQDGISYIAVGAGIVAGLVISVAIAFIALSRAVAWSPVRAAPRRLLALVAVLPVGAFLLAVSHLAARPGFQPGPESEYWSPALTTMVVLLVVAGVLALGAAVVSARRPALVLSLGAVVSLLGAVAAEPGSAATAIVGVAMLAASLIVPTPHPPADPAG